MVHGEFRPAASGREYCDADVLRQLRRRSLAMLRREVEPVEPEAYARFIQAWHGIPGERRGLDVAGRGAGSAAGRSAGGVGAGERAAAGPAAQLPRRRSRRAVHDGRRRLGRQRWRSGPTTAGSACTSPTSSPLLDASLEAAEPPTGPLHDAIRAHLASHGASFWNQLRAASADATDGELLAALWDLVWAGEVTNDSLAPLRAMLSGGKASRSSAAPRGRPRPGRLTRIGPPAGAGRWSLVAPQRLAGAVAHRRLRTPRRCSCSSGTAWSPARRCWPRA